MRDLTELDARARQAINSDRVTAATRKALQTRLDPPAAGPRVLSDAQMRTLRAVVDRLVPLGGLDLPGRLHALLAEGAGDGWRYANMPSDVEAHRTALDRLSALAFADLPADEQNAVLSAVQAGRPPGSPWPFPPARWFEEALGALARLAYSHPLVQVAIGYDGFADAHGMAPSA